MKNQDITNELENLRRRVSELEESEARLKGTERQLKENEPRFRLLYECAHRGNDDDTDSLPFPVGRAPRATDSRSGAGSENPLNAPSHFLMDI
jgi:hypothetical protein